MLKCIYFIIMRMFVYAVLYNPIMLFGLYNTIALQFIYAVLYSSFTLFGLPIAGYRYHFYSDSSKRHRDMRLVRRFLLILRPFCINLSFLLRILLFPILQIKWVLLILSVWTSVPTGDRLLARFARSLFSNARSLRSLAHYSERCII